MAFGFRASSTASASPARSVELEIPRANLALALASSNLGVELGQLAIVAGLLPILYLCHRATSYRRWVMPGLSLASAGLAVAWVVDRAFALEVMPF